MEENYSEEPPKKWHKKWWGVSFIVVAGLILIVLVVFGGQVYYYYHQIKSGRMPLPSKLKFQEASASTSSTAPVDMVKLVSTGEPSSSPDAPLTIVGFFDFECPYSREGDAVMRQLQTAYEDKVNFVFRNFPLTDIHPGSMLAAEASECAHVQNKFWPMSDKIFSDSNLGEENFRLYAAEIGLDTDQFTNCLDGYKSKGYVLKDILDGQTAGVNGTPTWFINGEKIEGVIPLDTFKKFIDYLLAKPKS